MQTKREQYFWDIVIAFGITLFLLNSVLFILFGQANTDEGWYLYASKLVYLGEYPYRDFAFTQTPLLPYIYGIAQNVFLQSMYLGRITSAIFSIIAFILSILIARNYGGKIASSITSLLGATFTYGIYFQSITKTYALTTFFFILAFFVLSSNLKQDLKLFLSTIFVLLATLTRLSALFFALPFIFYAFVSSKTKNKLFIIILCLLALSYLSLFALQNIDAAIWGLIAHHISGDTSIIEKTRQILDFRIPLLFTTFPQYLLMFTVVLLKGFVQVKNKIRNYPAILITTFGSVLFLIPNLISGGFYTEYFVPVIFVLFPILGIAYTKILQHQNSSPRALMNAVLLSTLILSLIRGWSGFIDVSGGNMPIDEIDKVSAIILKNTTLSDKVFLLEPLWLAIESHRQVMPNMTMAQFSFYETDTKTVLKLHLVNSQIILSYIENRIPKLIAITDLDRSILQNTSNYQKIITSLESNYSLIYSADNFGQFSDHIDIYVRMGDK